MLNLHKLSEQNRALFVSALIAVVFECFLFAIFFGVDWTGYSKIGSDVTHLLAQRIGDVTKPFRQDFRIDPSGATWSQFLVILGIGFPLFFGLILWQYRKLENLDPE